MIEPKIFVAMFVVLTMELRIGEKPLKDTHREIKPLKKIRNYRKSSRDEVFQVDTLK